MKISIIGDIVLQSNNYKIESVIYKYFKESDFVVCNLEGPIVYENEIGQANKKGPHVYNSPVVVELMRKLHITHVALANNHIMDYGIYGLKNTIEFLEDERIEHFGADISYHDAYNYKLIDCQGTRVALVAIAERQFGAAISGRGGFSWIFDSQTKDMISEAVRNADYVIAICHMGAEGISIPLKEVRDTYHKLVEQGVNIVVGGHTHTIQGVEKYLNGYIYYSLGDFLFQYDTRIFKEEHDNEGLILQIEFGEKGELARITEFETSYNGVLKIENGRNKFLNATRMLSSEQYNDIINQYCLTEFMKHHRDYYALVCGVDCNNELNLIEFAKHRLNKDPIKWDYMMLYHNLCIESNRWICQNALQQLYELELDVT